MITGEKWSGDVETKWHPKEGFFNQSADKIANGLKKASKDLKQAMSRLNFYCNRSGKNLSSEAKKRLETAKEKLRKLYETKQKTAASVAILSHDDEIKKGDLVISFHVDPKLPSFIIGQIEGTKEMADGTTRYILKGMFDVNCRGDSDVTKTDKIYFPPVNGTPTTLGGDHGLGHGRMNHVRKIR